MTDSLLEGAVITPNEPDVASSNIASISEVPIEDGSLNVPPPQPTMLETLTGDVKEMVVGGAQTLGSLAMKAGENYTASTQLDPFSRLGEAVGKTAYEAMPGKTPTDKAISGLDVVGRAGAQLAGALATGPLFPIGMAASGWVYDKVRELTDPTKELDFEDDLTQFRKEVVAGAVPYAASKVTGKTLSKVRDVYREKLNLPNKRVQTEYQATLPEALAGRLAPMGRDSVSRSLADDLVEAQPIFTREHKSLFGNVDRKLLSNKVARSNPELANGEALKFQANLTYRIQNLAEKKATALSKLEIEDLTRKPKAPIGKIKADDLDFSGITEKIAKRDASIITQPEASQLQGVLDEVKGDFFHDTNIINPKTGKPFITERSFGLTDAQKMLDNMYARLEQARVFDAQVQQAKIANPGLAMSENAALVEVLRKSAKTLKDRIAKVSNDLATAYPELGYKKGDVQFYNETIHNLIPVRTAYRMQTMETARGMGQGSVASLTGAVRAPGVTETVLDPLISPVKEARTLATVSGRNPEIVGSLEEIGRVAQSGPTKPYGFEALPSLGSGIGAGQALISANQLESLRKAEEAQLRYQLSEASNKFNMDLSSFPSVQIDNGRVFIDDPNDQQEILSIYREDPTIPMSHYYKQANKFNDKRVENELLPIPKKKNVTEPMPSIRLKKGSSNKSGNYSY
jgi:hypothetical protein